MHEMVTFAERVPKLANGTAWKRAEIKRLLPAPLKDSLNVESWCTLYSIHDIKSSIAKIQTVGFSEKLDLFGVLQLTPVSSGYSVGSCNWIIQSEYEKISYLSSSSSFTTHPLPFEPSCLRGSDVLILSGLAESPTSNPDVMLGEFCTNLANTIKGGGNVLVPCFPSGVIYDLFECLQSYMDSAGLTFTPIYFISPVADSSLAYSNIYAEWLCQSKQSKVYLPEPPFPHAELVKNGKLKHFPNLHDGFSNTFKTPCIVFTGHPSLRFGDVVHFVEMWGSSSANTIIFTEPGFPFLDALAPYQPLAMKACYCPIDPRLNFGQVNKTVREMKPRFVVIPEEYTVPPPMLPHRTDLVVQLDNDSQVLPISYPHVIDIPVTRSYEKVSLSNKLATTLCPQEVRAGTAVAMVNGTLQNKNNKYTLQPFERSSEGSSSNKCLCGDLMVDEMVASLAKRGITDVEVEQTPSGHTVHLNDDDAVVTLEKGSTHIITHGNDQLRKTIRDALLDCLSQM
ncbi:integrator complex subunit 9 [Paramuricea clavata]|uniref:Integrator complex subunit 9 n=2 Tax=Paramuricea clavata TaxID=317549 RepID=A0A6S7JMA0_PARCT|nr:integrator complex subunit 9 [Paramuricea clavata]